MEQKEWHHMVTIEDLEGLQKKINIVYDPIGVKMAFEKACKIVGEKIQIKGFRKGKAPRKLIERAHPEKIKEVAGSLLSQEGFLHACYEHKIAPLNEPNIEKMEFPLDGTFSCDIILEVKPKITPSGYLGMKLKKLDQDIEQMSENILDGVKHQHMTNNVVDEAINGSYVTIDYWILVDGEKISEAKDQQVLVDEKQEAPFGKNLIGVKRGDMLKENVVMPDVVPEYGGKDAEANIEVKLVCEKILPSNEELVKKMQAPSFEHLLNVIKQNAQMKMNENQRRSLEEEIIDKLSETHEFEIPKQWVKDEQKYLESQLNLQTVDDDSRKTIQNLAERNVKRSFLLEAIYDIEQGLTVTKEEFEKLIESEAKHLNTSKTQLKNDLKKKGMLDSVFGLLKHRKVFDFIISQAQIGEAEETQQNLIVPENPFGG